MTSKLRQLTVGDLRLALEGVSDATPVVIHYEGYVTSDAKTCGMTEEQSSERPWNDDYTANIVPTFFVGDKEPS